MAYATNQNIKDRFGVTLIAQLTTEASSSTPDEAVITVARKGAEALIDSYLSKRYRVPIDVVIHTEVASLLNIYTLDLVLYRLRKDKGPVPESVSKQYDEVIKWLTAVAAGEADLPAVDVAIEGPSVTGPLAEADGAPRIFSRDKTGGL